MTKMELVRELRNAPKVHFNCCQAVLVPFAEECGLTVEAAYNLGTHFGGGMKMGSVCGAITGALMALGAVGCDEEARKTLIARFKEKNNYVNCADLLKQATANSEDRKSHCDRMVYECVALAEELINQKK